MVKSMYNTLASFHAFGSNPVFKLTISPAVSWREVSANIEANKFAFFRVAWARDTFGIISVTSRQKIDSLSFSRGPKSLIYVVGYEVFCWLSGMKARYMRPYRGILRDLAVLFKAHFLRF